MKRIVAISGVPGTGKSTLMKAFMKNYSWEIVCPEPLVNGHYCKELDLFVLGKYISDEVFPGTDKLSMGVQPNAEKFVRETESNVLLEGDRLTNMKFYNFLLELGVEVYFIILKTDDNILSERYIERGSDQSGTFLKGRETKIKNIENNMDYWENTKSFKNNTLEDQKAILSQISEILV